MDCSICLDALDSGVVALPCGHRFHAACLAQCAAAVGTAATTSRRGTLTACPNCRTTSRVAPAATSAAFSVGDRVLALWGHKWFPGDVYAVKDGGSAYEIAWDDEDASNEIPASRVRAAPLTVDVDAPDPCPAAVVTPRAAPPVMSPPAPAPRSSGPPPAQRAVVPQARPPARPAPAPSASRPHVASSASAWVAVCTDLLDVTKDRTNMEGLRVPLTSRGFICGPDQKNGILFSAAVPPEFPCYYDVIGKDYAHQDYASSLTALRRYLEGALALAQAGGAYRTQKDAAERAAGEFDRCDTCNLAPPLATFSRRSGKRRRTCDLCRAEKRAPVDEAWKAAGVPADLSALRKAYAREQAAKKLRPRRPSAPPETAP